MVGIPTPHLMDVCGMHNHKQILHKQNMTFSKWNMLIKLKQSILLDSPNYCLLVESTLHDPFGNIEMNN
jgi:hypothetical protein